MTAITEGEQVGIGCVLALNGGTNASPTWGTITRAKDVSVPNTKSAAELSSRLTSYKLKKGALKEVAIEFGYQYKRGTDSVFSTLEDSYVNGTPIQVWACDDVITLTGAKGWKFYGEVMEFDCDQPLEDGVTYKVKIEATVFYESGSQVFPSFATV